MKTHFAIFGALFLFVYIVFFARVILPSQVHAPAQATQPAPLLPLVPIHSVLQNPPQNTKVAINYATAETAPYLEKYFSKAEANPCPAQTHISPDLFLLFVNQNNALDDAFVPDDLVPLPAQYTKTASGVVCMRVEAAQAFINMVADAQAKQHMIVASSGFRSAQTQKYILEGRLAAIGDKAYTHVALPGHSEHQLGVAADVTSLAINYDSAAHAFGDSPDGKWMFKHAHEYGFVQSYPYGKEYITGYIYEPWHYRYVGIELAEKLHDAEMTLTEYLENKRE